MGWLAASLLRLAINSPLHSFQKNRNPGKPMLSVIQAIPGFICSFLYFTNDRACSYRI